MNKNDQMLERIIGTLVEAGWSVSKEPDKILHRVIPDYRCRGDEWELFVNGNTAPREVKTSGGVSISVDPFHFVVFWNGWLAGIFSPDGGTFAAHPEGANAETFHRSIVKTYQEDDIEPPRSIVPGPEAA